MRPDMCHWAGVVAAVAVTASSGSSTAAVVGQATWRAPESQLAPAGSSVRAGIGEIGYSGGRIELPVEALQVTGLGAGTIVVAYDPNVLAVATCRRNPAFDVGLCNTRYDRDEDGRPDAVRFNVVSLDGQSSVAETPLNLTTITFEAVGRAGERSALELDVLTFTDTNGRSIAVTTEDGRVDIGDGRPPTSLSEVFLPLLRYD